MLPTSLPEFYTTPWYITLLGWAFPFVATYCLHKLVLEKMPPIGPWLSPLVLFSSSGLVWAVGLAPMLLPVQCGVVVLFVYALAVVAHRRANKETYCHSRRNPNPTEGSE